MADNIATKDDLTILEMSICKKLDAFEDKYDLDMRGDTVSTNGGRRGMVENIRELRRYPSITWLFAHKPLQTALVVIGIFVILFAMMSVGLLNLLGAMLGLKLPDPITLSIVAWVDLIPFYPMW